MEAFTKYQHMRIITKEGTIANGDYTLTEEGITLHIKDGLLNDILNIDGQPEPALFTNDFTHIEHWKNGVLHCDYEPAVIDTVDGYELWFSNGIQIESR